VRAGLAALVAGATVAGVRVDHPRAVRRHSAGSADLADRLAGRVLGTPSRRGKYLWVPLGPPGGAPAGPPEPGDDAWVVHLGMSGQLRVVDGAAPRGPHLRVALELGDGRELRFVDQRTFGAVAVEALVPAPPGPPVPATVAHIARDPFDPAFDAAAVVAGLRRRDTGLKRALLDQTLVSGVGNIYADEALWRARLHYARPTRATSTAQARALLDAAAAVMGDALAAGGTSFDALYVHVNGESGYFDRALAVYGQQGRPCPRCGTAVVREPFMNRSSFRCPRCQRPPRAR